MAGRGVWHCYSLLLFLAKCISGFGIEQSFTIYMDVGNDIENVIKWGTTCEAKQTNMESILQRNIWELKESERKLNEKISNSNSKIANLEKRVDSFEQKLILMENTLQSTMKELKKKEEELKNSISKLSSAVDALNSRTEHRPTSNLSTAINVPEIGRLAEQSCINRERNKPPNFPIGNFHYMASIGVETAPHNYRSHCTGALIEKRFLVTTAQCISKVKVNIARVGFASRLDSLAMDVVVRKIKKVHLHPKFSRFTRDNNYVGLVELEKELSYSALLYPICLFTSPTIPVTNGIVYYAHWDENRKLISGQILRRMVPYKRCKTLEDNHISPNQICTKIDTSLATDSGPETDENSVMDIRIASNGPLVLLAYDMNEKHHRLIAVDSESEQLNSSYTSHHITSVYDNLDFIENIVWKGE
uniref:Serine protease persephone n=1 Tax=Ceratitis capitata TaxID=7213 RepID=W8B0G1_CERCA